MLAEGSRWISHPDLAAVVRDVLSHGQSFRFRAHGLSMLPFIRPGDRLTVQSLGAKAPRVGDVILYQVAGERLAAHRVVRDTAGAAFGSAIRSSAQRRLSFRCSKAVPLREVECREGLGGAPGKHDPVGGISEAHPPSHQPVATSSNQECATAAGTGSIDQNGLLQVRGDRLWAPLELVHPGQVLGQVVAIERNGCARHLTRARHRLVGLAWIGLRPLLRAARSRLGKMKRRVSG